MENKIILTSMKFDDEQFDSVSYGYLISIGKARDFYNLAESFIENDVEILKLAIKHSPSFFSKIRKEEIGLEINHIWWEFDEVAEFLGIENKIKKFVTDDSISIEKLFGLLLSYPKCCLEEFRGSTENKNSYNGFIPCSNCNKLTKHEIEEKLGRSLEVEPPEFIEFADKSDGSFEQGYLIYQNYGKSNFFKDSWESSRK